MELRRTLVWSLRVIATAVMLCTAGTAYAAGALSNLVIAGLSPAFDPNVTQYTVQYELLRSQVIDSMGISARGEKAADQPRGVLL